MCRTRTTLAAEACRTGTHYRQKIANLPRSISARRNSPDRLVGGCQITSAEPTTHESGSRASFRHSCTLREDSQFYAKTPQELLNRAAGLQKYSTANRRNTLLSAAHALRHQTRSGRSRAILHQAVAVRAFISEHIRPAASPIYNLPALTCTNPRPDTHSRFRCARARPPEFRHRYISAHGEGWAFIVKSWARKWGCTRAIRALWMLGYQIWRAARLVWTPAFIRKDEQALKYMHDYTALPI